MDNASGPRCLGGVRDSVGSDEAGAGVFGVGFATLGAADKAVTRTFLQRTFNVFASDAQCDAAVAQEMPKLSRDAFETARLAEGEATSAAEAGDTPKAALLARVVRNNDDAGRALSAAGARQWRWRRPKRPNLAQAKDPLSLSFALATATAIARSTGPGVHYERTTSVIAGNKTKNQDGEREEDARIEFAARTGASR